MKFKYSAKTQQGELQMGEVEAGSKDAAFSILSGHNLYILSLAEAEKQRFYDRIASYFRGVKRKDIVVFTRQLATLLEARLPLNDSLKTLSEQTANPVLKEAVIRLSEDIDAGLSFSQAIERQSTIFSQFFASMVRSAEITGNMDQVVGFLADYFEEEAILVGKAKSAMIYPAVIISLFIVVSIIMITVVFPQLRPIFEQSEVDLPLMTRMLLGAGDFFGKFWLALLLGVVFLVSATLNYLRTDEGHALRDDLTLRLPLIRKVYIPISLARFSNAASILIKGGVPISQAMEIVSHVIDNTLYRDVIHDASEAVREGVPLSTALSRNPDLIPSLVPQMLVVGEATGQIDKIFARLSAYYKRESDVTINTLVELIQPILMIGVGILVGLLFSSVLLPLYDLTSKIS